MCRTQGTALRSFCTCSLTWTLDPRSFAQRVVQTFVLLDKFEVASAMVLANNTSVWFTRQLIGER